MHETRINTLVRELIAHDPTLASHEDDLRVLVSRMLEAQPNITVSETFRESLRARLVSTAAREALAAKPSPYGWAMRLLPLGMVALLVLALLPERTHYLPPNTQIGEEQALEYETSVSDRDFSRSAPSASQDFGMGGDMNMMDTGVMRDYTVSNQPSFKATSPAPPPFSIDPQGPAPRILVRHVTVSKPSFIVIYAPTQNGEAVVFGVSPLVYPGTTTNLPINTHSPTRSGGMYFATLVTDSGDRRFHEREDMPYTHTPDGNPYMIPIVIE